MVLTLCQHAHLFALPEPAFLALPAHVHVHLAGPPTLTLVHSILRDTSPEEPCREEDSITYLSAL